MQPRVKQEVYALQGELYFLMAELATPLEDYEKSR